MNEFRGCKKTETKTHSLQKSFSYMITDHTNLANLLEYRF